MKKPIKAKKRRDSAELAKAIVDCATGNETAEQPTTDETAKNPHAVALSKLGASKGGVARWKGVSKKKRTVAAKKAARARWKKSKPKP